MKFLAPQNMCVRVPSAWTFHLEISQREKVTLWNVCAKLRTLDTSQSPMSSLNQVLPMKSHLKEVILLTSQVLILQLGSVSNRPRQLLMAFLSAWTLSPTNSPTRVRLI